MIDENKIFKPSIDITQQLLKNFTGENTSKTNDFNKIIEYLKSGKNGIIVNLLWNEQRDDKFYERHEIVLEKLEGNRIYFFNPLKTTNIKIGDVISGNNRGPKRRLEPHGFESMEISTLQNIFNQGNALALI